MFLSSSPTLNLHGETRDTITFLVNDFINDNYLMGKVDVGIIHGRSSNILKNKVHEILKSNKKVISYHLDPFNPGITIVKIVKK